MQFLTKRLEGHGVFPIIKINGTAQLRSHFEHLYITEQLATRQPALTGIPGKKPVLHRNNPGIGV